MKQKQVILKNEKKSKRTSQDNLKMEEKQEIVTEFY